MSSEMIEQSVLVVHLLLSLAIIGLIMLQQGKGADMGASFGAGASQTLFGSSGSGNVLTRATSWMVALFFATSFGLAIIAKDKVSGSADFDLAIPETENVQVLDAAAEAVDDVPAAADSDIPALSDDLPVSVEGATNEDLPEL